MMAVMSALSAAAERVFAGRWIAGADMESAIRTAKMLRLHKIGSIINYLGEEYTETAQAERSTSMYLKLVNKLAASGVSADLSVKPTQLGLLISEAAALKNYSKIVAAAGKHRIFVWLDMEAPEHVGATIEAYLKHVSTGTTGICIQSYLKRSRADLSRIIKSGGTVRLVKGAYAVSGRDGYQTREAVNRNYELLMKMLFAGSARFTLATHDARLINKALVLNRAAKRQVTFAMLKGIRNRLAAELVGKGNRVSLYVPFGEEWIPYSYRRLKEAGHLKLILKSLFEKQGLETASGQEKGAS